MDLEKAYNKIDNFCCSNHNTLQGNTVRYLNGREEIIDMFSDYKENQDDDFCKDVYEMTDALETIKKVVDLQKEIGCSFVILSRAIKEGIWSTEYWYCEKEENQNKLKHIFPKFTILENEWGLDCGDHCYYFVSLKDYKKTWWLRDDRSE